MRRWLRRPQVVEPEVSEAEKALFGGPLRYDMGWNQHEDARLKLTMWSAIRTLPGLVGSCLRLAWAADRRALRTVAAAEVGQGICEALGLLAVNAVLHALLAGGTAADRLRDAVPALVAGGVVAVVSALFASLSTAAAGRLEPKVERLATERYLTAVAGVEMEAVESPEFQRLIDVAQFGAASARRMISACVPAVNSVFGMIAAGSVLSILHPVLLPLLLLIAVPRGWGAMRVSQQRYVSVMQWIEHVRASRLIGNLLTKREAAAEVRAHQVGSYLLRHYRSMAETAEGEQTRLAHDKAAIQLLASALSGAMALCTYGLLIALIVGGRMELAAAGTAVMGIRSGAASLGALAMNVNQLHEESLYVRDLDRFLARAHDHAIPATGAPLAGPLHTLTVEGITFTYPDRDTPALKDVSLTVRTGQVIALVGANGSGKSTLVKLLAGLYLPDSGDIRWDGTSITDADRAEVFAQIGLLGQDFEEWPFTAAANLHIGRPDLPRDPERLEAAAAWSGADKLIDELPNGWNTLLARMFRGASDLSGGQWQKIALSRTWMRRDARLLIVDEPTSALDPEAEIATFDKIRELATPHRAVVLVTHRMAAVQHADHIYVLTEGALTEHGTHADLMAAGARYAAMYTAQASQFALPAVNGGPVIPAPAREP
ncbi:Vitamin B12 import ATP-binding protein BtuD [Streptomyces sp. RB5]|uniref:Vitamin B12 import ATP-binding protein BtuD n=1 Tax=Streptomyces smaragdinus TaxID=2585196 RepID=A0A7K0CLX7_9ACTN|nr:ABC transporter ATP-binding protein [Streptomyces smaragdinus]MQY14486.1 Vitamin B12 import ATP-binding protein BtuD [Streptomyces smaragdinus]